jgi:hypothetical protein
VEWSKLIEGALTTSPMALVLGFAVWRLWQKLEAKDAEIQRLNEARAKDLLSISHGSGDG